MFNRPQIVIFGFLSLFTAVIVLLTGLFTNLLDKRFLTDALYQINKEVDPKLYLQMMDQELPGQLLSKEEMGNSPSMFEQLLSINLNDPLTFMGREIPGLHRYKRDFMVANKDNEINDVPEEDEITPELLAEMRSNEIIPERVPDVTAVNAINSQKPAVFVYHTHNRESWMSEVPNAKNHIEAMHPSRNITLVGKTFSEELQRLGIPVFYDNTDHYSLLKKKKMNFSLSYAISLETVKEAMTNHRQIQYIFDFHRDAIGRDKTTVTIDGVEYARIMFVIGKNNKNWEENMEFATKLQEIIERKYPGITRSIFGKNRSTGNGEYNQSISSNALTVEIGGVENTLEESQRTAKILADAFAELYLNAVPVFQANRGGK
jgi:stage II sporulation protein P